MRQDLQRTLRHLSDGALIDAMRGGATEAWQEFMMRFRPVLIQYGLRTKMDPSVVSGGVDQVLEEAAMRWAVEGTAPPKDIIAYLLRALSFHRRTLERDDKRRVRQYERASEAGQYEGAILSLCSEASVRDSNGPAENESDSTQTALERLCHLLRQSLGDDDAKILTRLGDGLPHREIATELGLGYDAGRKRIQRLCSRLRDLMPEVIDQLSSADRIQVERVLRRLEPLRARGIGDAV
jgi:DNA-directed RNA polymerase specialized sigma24 family protein